MRMRRTLTKVLCVTLAINATFLMFVVYSRLSRNARINGQKPRSHLGGNALAQKGTAIKGVKNLEEFRKRVEESDNTLRRDWKLKVEQNKENGKMTVFQPAQLFNVQKSLHGAQCAEFLQTPVWFKSPPNSEDQHPPADFWQSVSPANNDFYVFSAYFDVHGTTFWDSGKSIAPVVRIIGATTQRSLKKPLFCQMWFDSKDKLRVEQAILSGIPESHDRNYTATFYLCPLWIPGVAPYAVSLVTDKCAKPYNLIYVHPVPKKQLPAKDFTVCVSPLNLQYNKVNELVQMIEFNSLFGADFFQFYNFSTGPDADLVLDHYKKEGLLEVIQWNLPLKVDDWPYTDEVEIHYFGQLAALNDCLYRNMFSSKFLVFTDMDELIVPRKQKYWSAMLDHLPETPVYHFRCAFFRKDSSPSSKNFTGIEAAKKLKLHYLLNTDRETTILPVFSRSKFIINPRKVETVGIHTIWVLRAGTSQHVVLPYMALLHHYRVINLTANKTYDAAILKFTTKILYNVKERWQKLRNVTFHKFHISYKPDL